MQTIFVMVKCELGTAYKVAAEAADLEQVSEVHSVSGEHDLLVKCYVDSYEDIGQFVVDTLQKVPGVKDTFTLIAFKAFS